MSSKLTEAQLRDLVEGESGQADRMKPNPLSEGRGEENRGGHTDRQISQQMDGCVHVGGATPLPLGADTGLKGVTVAWCEWQVTGPSGGGGRLGGTGSGLWGQRGHSGRKCSSLIQWVWLYWLAWSQCALQAQGRALELYCMLTQWRNWSVKSLFPRMVFWLTQEFTDLLLCNICSITWSASGLWSLSPCCKYICLNIFTTNCETYWI